MSHTVSSKMQPGVIQTISDAEYELWLQLGIVYEGAPVPVTTSYLDAQIAELVDRTESATRAELRALMGADAGGLNDAVVKTLVNDGASQTGIALRAAFGLVFTPEAFGAKGDGTTDDTTAVRAAIQAAYDGGGGTIVFGAKTYRIDGQLVIPNDGAASPIGRPLHFVGSGGQWDGSFQTNGVTAGGTVLDLRSTTGPAKIDARGRGVLVLEHMTLTQKGSAADTNPFVQTTHTTLMARDCVFLGHTSVSRATCVQDAIVLGGTIAEEFGNGPNSGFHGYGTVIERCYFGRIRRGVYGRTYCNNVVIRDNTWSSSCGGGSDAAALHIDGSVGFAWGNIITGNLFELSGYVYGLRLTRSQRNYCVGNGFWDDSVSLVACIFLDARAGQAADCYGNYFQSTFTGTPDAKLIVDGAGGTTSYTFIENGYMTKPLLAGSPTTVRPMRVGASEFDAVFEVRRSNAEASNPGAAAIIVQQNGQAFVGGSWSNQAFLRIQNGGTNYLVADHQSVVQGGTGSMDLYAGTGASSGVRVKRGVLGLPPFATSGRPTAANAGAGGAYYDTTLSKPAFSDGTNWRDAAGTIV